MRYICFLRGINVGGNNKIEMRLLKNSLHVDSISNVNTYLNSGNIILDSKLNENELKAKIEEIIQIEFDINIVVFILKYNELLKIIENMPFNEVENEKSKQLVYFFSYPINREDIDMIKNGDKIIESIYILKGKILYVYYNSGLGKSKLTTNYIESKLKLRTTGRNMNTIQLLIEKGSS